MDDDDRIPSGYRQAITTAITVFLGFSITFLRTFRSVRAEEGWSVLEEVAETGVGWISMGAMTHSAPALDLSLNLEVLR